MKQINKPSALAVGAITIGLLLGASTAQAANVELDGSGNVIRVTNLELDFDTDALDGFYNVDFITGVGSDIYGLDPAAFDFSPAEENSLALMQLNAALNDADTVPVGAGSMGSEQYFIPAIEYNFPLRDLDIWGAFGGEKSRTGWEDCKSDCLFGVSVLHPDDENTFAKFSVVGVSTIPVPAAVWLFGSGLLGLIGIARRKKS